jgi:Ubiquinone biosynthesis protein COQ7
VLSASEVNELTRTRARCAISLAASGGSKTTTASAEFAAEGAENAPAYPLMSLAIRLGCRTAIALSKRI